MVPGVYGTAFEWSPMSKAVGPDPGWRSAQTVPGAAAKTVARWSRGRVSGRSNRTGCPRKQQRYVDPGRVGHPRGWCRGSQMARAVGQVQGAWSVLATMEAAFAWTNWNERSTKAIDYQLTYRTNSLRSTEEIRDHLSQHVKV